jgi:hypothetical protein
MIQLIGIAVDEIDTQLPVSKAVPVECQSISFLKAFMVLSKRRKIFNLVTKQS